MWRRVFGGLLGLSLMTTSSVWAQGSRAAVELRGGVNVPTFDIADVAKAGPSAGVGLNVKLGQRAWLIGDADFGFHSGTNLPIVGAGPDVNVFHYIAKVGYEVLNVPQSNLTLILNAGAGGTTFAIDGGATYTYPAINVGAKLIYGLGGPVSLVLSPQGDITFSKRSELGTTNSWVWPFAVGLRFGL